MARAPFGFFVEHLSGLGLYEGASSLESVTIGSLKKREGESIHEGETILTIESEKGEADVASPVSGKIVLLHYKDGEEWRSDGEKQKTPFGIMLTPALGEIEIDGEEALAELKADAGDKTKAVNLAPEKKIEKILYEDIEHARWEENGGSIISAVPAARHLAREKGVDLSEINGTGPNGLILVSDIEGEEAACVQEDRYAVPASAVRKEIAELLTYSAQNIPHAGDSVRVCVTSLRKFREEYKGALQEKGITVRYDHIFMYLAARLLKKKEFAVLNGYWDKEREALVFMKDVNIGFAMHVVNARNGESYLAVPVIHKAQDLSFAGLLFSVESKIERARRGLLRASEYRSLTFTINNVGALGGIAPDSIIPSVRKSDGSIRPTAMILTLGAFEWNSADAEWYMNLGMKFDHRLFDGIEPMTFLNVLKAKIEDFKLN